MRTLKTSQKYEGVRSKELNNGDIAYYVRWTDESGKRFERKVGTKAGGWNEKKASIKRLELLNSKNIINSKIIISDIIDRYLDIQKIHVKPRTFIDYKGQCLLHIVPFFGSYSIETINSETISDFMIYLKSTKSNKTINKLVERLSHIIDWCISEYNLSIKNPVKSIKKLKVDNARERFLSKQEIETLLNTAKLHHNKEVYLFFVLALSTGGRLNSIRNIKLEDISFDDGTVKMQDFKNNTKYTAFLTQLAKDALKNYKDNIIFKTPERTITRAMQGILNDLFNKNIDKNDRKNRVVIHSIRHTFASHLAIQGTPIHIIQKLLNHKDIKMTMRYSHLLPSSGKEWVDRLWNL